MFNNTIAVTYNQVYIREIFSDQYLYYMVADLTSDVKKKSPTPIPAGTDQTRATRYTTSFI